MTQRVKVFAWHTVCVVRVFISGTKHPKLQSIMTGVMGVWESTAAHLTVGRKQKGRESERGGERNGERERERERERQRNGEGERENGRERKGERERERKRKRRGEKGRVRQRARTS